MKLSALLLVGMALIAIDFSSFAQNVGIGTVVPTYKLDVVGDIGLDGFLYHNDDANTFLYFTPDRIQFDAGGRNFIDIQYLDNEIAINEGSTQTDFRVEGGLDQNLLFTDGSADYVAIGANNPTSKLDVNGQIRMRSGAMNGYIPVSDASGVMTWTDPASLVSGNTLDEAYDEGGAGAGATINATDGVVSIQGQDGFEVTGLYNNGAAIGSPGAGTRMIFNPAKAAFRAGRASGTGWDEASVGSFSAAVGNGTVASGDNSFAAGNGSIASGDYSSAMGSSTASNSYSVALGQSSAIGNQSIALGRMSSASGSYSAAIGNFASATSTSSMAIGDGADATGDYAVAIGREPTASGESSVSLGTYTEAESGYETVIGRWNTDYTPINTSGWWQGDRLFVIGNGTSSGTRSDAMVVLKNGNTGIGTSSPQRTLHVSDVLRLEPSASAPASPSAGDMYFDSTISILRVYDGSIWQDCW